MKTNLIKTELTIAQILNHQLNWGYQPNAKDLDNLCPIIHLSKLEIDQEDNQPLDQYLYGRGYLYLRWCYLLYLQRLTIAN